MPRCFVCSTTPAEILLAACSECATGAWLCADCEMTLIEEMRAGAVELWRDEHVCVDTPADVEHRFKLALDELHQVRVALERIGLSQLSFELGASLQEVEEVYSRTKPYAQGAS